MSIENFIIQLFCRLDDKLKAVKKHPQAKLYPSEIVTLSLLFAIKGSKNRAWYRWIINNYKHLFPNIPDRTRLIRLFKSHQKYVKLFLEDETILGVSDSFGIELIHPIRQRRSSEQIGKKGLSNHRWIVGMKIAIVVNQFGSIVGWECDTANVHDSSFHSLIRKSEGKMIVLTDTGFVSQEGNPSNMMPCKRGSWNCRMLVETVFSMLSNLSDIKRMYHRKLENFKAHLGSLVAAYNLLINWAGLKPDDEGFIPLSITNFNL